MIKTAWDDTKSSSDPWLASDYNTAITEIKSRIKAYSSDTLTNKTIDGDDNTISNLDIGNEVSWAASSDVTDASAFESGDKLLVFETGVGLRKIDYDDLPSGGGGSGNPQDTISIDGELSTGTKAVFAMSDERNGLVVKEVRLLCLGLPTGADLQVDICKNGTATTDSIFTSDVPIEIPTGQTTTNGIYQTACDTSGARVGTPGTTLDSARDDVASDDVLYIIVRQVGSTIAGRDLRIIITYGSV